MGKAKEYKGDPDVGLRLRVARAALHTNQMEMAAKLGINQSSYNLMENGRRPITVEILKAYVALGFDATWILTGVTKPQYDQPPQDTITRITNLLPKLDSRQLEFLLQAAMLFAAPQEKKTPKGDA